MVAKIAQIRLSPFAGFSQRTFIPTGHDRCRLLATCADGNGDGIP